MELAGMPEAEVELERNSSLHEPCMLPGRLIGQCDVMLGEVYPGGWVGRWD
jgi:hypothetical protein